MIALPAPMFALRCAKCARRSAHSRRCRAGSRLMITLKGPRTKATQPKPCTGDIGRPRNMRLKGKVAIVIGAGQSPGEGMGNGRATVLRFAQEGATVMAVDRDLASAEETVAMASKHSPGVAFEADVTKEKTLAAMVGSARSQF